MAAYVVAVCEITDFNEGLKQYSARAAELVHKHGGKYLIRGPKTRSIEGELLDNKLIILIEFPTMEQLNAFIDDPEYKNDVAPLRAGSGDYHFASYEGAPPHMQ